MLSTEEVTLTAMRRGRDGELVLHSSKLPNLDAIMEIDVMMFLNVAVAITCFAFCWTLSIVAFNGWLKSRSQPRHSSSIDQ
jgi:hypothetical protein